MRRVLVIGITLVVLTGAAAINARTQTSYSRYGAGISSCGTWLENRRSSNELRWMANGQWVMGWLSAAGHYGQSLKKTDSAAITAWIDNYCTTNPLEDIEKAATGLVEALRVK